MVGGNGRTGRVGTRDYGVANRCGLGSDSDKQCGWRKNIAKKVSKTLRTSKEVVMMVANNSCRIDKK